MNEKQAKRIAGERGFFNPEMGNDASTGGAVAEYRFWNDDGDMAIIIEDDGTIGYCDADGMPCDADGKPDEYAA